jgi:hypothetical protein
MPSNIARRAMNTNSTNGFMPHVTVRTADGKLIQTSFFGGPIKCGGPPSGTGQIRGYSLRPRSWPTAYYSQVANKQFIFRTRPGQRPYGHHLGIN